MVIEIKIHLAELTDPARFALEYRLAKLTKLADDGELDWDRKTLVVPDSPWVNEEISAYLLKYAGIQVEVTHLERSENGMWLVCGEYFFAFQKPPLPCLVSPHIRRAS